MKKLLSDFKLGKPVIVFDNEDRENEADIIIPIEKATPETINFMITHAKGLLCAALSNDIVKNIGLPLMPSLRNDNHQTAFTLSVDSKLCTTGISPEERCITAKDLITPGKKLSDFITPGHIFPLIAKDGLTLERAGHTEAAVELCRMSGLTEGALICEMIKVDGSMYSKKEAERFAYDNEIKFCSIADIVEHRKKTEPNVKLISKSKLFTDYGEFNVAVYNELFTDKEHLFISKGDLTDPVVRIHSQCLTGEVFHSQTCDCRQQLDEAMRSIADNGSGAICYLRQEGRDIGIGEKIKAYNLQQNYGLDTVDANTELGHKDDERDFHQAAWMLKINGYDKIRLLTNNPDKINYLIRHGISVTPVATGVFENAQNMSYLSCKKKRMGHRIKINDLLKENM